MRSGQALGPKHLERHQLAASRLRCEQPRRTIEAGEFRPYVIVLNHQDNAGVLAPPLAIRGEVARVVKV